MAAFASRLDWSKRRLRSCPLRAAARAAGSSWLITSQETAAGASGRRYTLGGHRLPRLYRDTETKRFGARPGVQKPRDLGGEHTGNARPSGTLNFKQTWLACSWVGTAPKLHQGSRNRPQPRKLESGRAATACRSTVNRGRASK
jgi:hypothetical protein